MLIDFNTLYNKYNLSITGVIHVGAHLAEEYKYYKKYNIQDIIWIEANKNLIDIIKTKTKNENKVIQCIVSDHKGTETLYMTNQTQSWSIFKPQDNLSQRKNLFIEKTLEIKCNKLDNIITNKEKYNFINLDIQGGELKALRGYSDGLKYIDYIYTEVHTGNTYKNCPKISDLDKYLETYKFRRVETNILKRKKWGDAFYIKEIK